MEAAVITDSAGAVVDLEQLRDDLTGDEGEDVSFDGEGRRYHLHGDGSIHYLDEE